MNYIQPLQCSNNTCVVRLTLTFFMYIYFKFINVSPNSNREEKLKHKNNKIFKHDSFFWYMMRETILGIYVIWFAGNTIGSITLFEYILFLISSIFIFIIIMLHITLNIYFTLTIGTFQDHKLIDTGIYSILIHPYYLSEFIIWNCTLLFFRVNFWMYIFISSIVLSYIQNKIYVEEKLMLAKFGDEYKQYCKKRYRFIPFLKYEYKGFVL